MNRYLRFFTLICLIAIGCKGRKNAAVSEEQEAKGNYFPVRDYLLSEIAYVDSMPFKIVQYRTQNGKKDSGMILTRDFDLLAKAFLPAGLDSNSFSKNFKEASFMDQTTQSLTFNYTLLAPDSGLQRVDVLATPSTGFDKVKSLYMEQSWKRNDTSILERMSWKSRKQFQIISIYTPPTGESFSTQLDVVWDAQ